MLALALLSVCINLVFALAFFGIFVRTLFLPLALLSVCMDSCGCACVSQGIAWTLVLRR